MFFISYIQVQLLKQELAEQTPNAAPGISPQFDVKVKFLQRDQTRADVLGAARSH